MNKRLLKLYWIVVIVGFEFLLDVECLHEGILINDLLKNYNKVARPRRNSSEHVVISLDFFLTRIDALNLRKQYFTVTGWLYTEWQDDFLIWNPQNYSNITRIVIPASNVWLPDVSLGNSVDEFYKTSFVELFRVAVYYTGKVIWEPAGVFSTSCPIDNTFYPFDHQSCELSFDNWQYTADQVQLVNRSSTVGLENYANNGEWTIEHTSVKRSAFTYQCCPDLQYPEVAFKIHVRRKFMYYFVNIMIPCLMMSLLVLMEFFLPPDAGEKISLGVTVLLSFSVFQLMIAEDMPTSSSATPLLEIYLLCFMGASTFSVTISVLVLNIHHRTEYNPPPAWIRTVCFQWMAPWLCLKRVKVNAVNSISSNPDESPERIQCNIQIDPESNTTVCNEQHGSQECHVLPVRGESAYSGQLSGSCNSDKEIKSAVSSAHLMSVGTAKNTVRLMHSIANLDGSKSMQSRREFLSAVKDVYHEICQTRKDEELETALENEWKLIARVVDRFFFIVCTTLLIVSSAVIFGIMPYNHEDIA